MFTIAITCLLWVLITLVFIIAESWKSVAEDEELRTIELRHGERKV